MCVAMVVVEIRRESVVSSGSAPDALNTSSAPLVIWLTITASNTHLTASPPQMAKGNVIMIIIVEFCYIFAQYLRCT